MKTYPTTQHKKLIGAIASLTTEKEAQNFIRDLLTPAEIDEFAKRFEIAGLLWTTQLSYLQIAEKIGTSTTTVTRVSQWLFKEKSQGYATILKRTYGNSVR